jgi:formylmethanofuran dehydrogenase subunit E
MNENIKQQEQQGNSIFCDDCGDEIHGLYEDNGDGTYTCISCDLKRQDGYDIDNCMGCDW